MKKLLKFLCVTLCFSLGFLFLASCKTRTEDSEASKLSYVGMRINPEIELVVDENNTVVGVNAVNEDGDTVLAEADLNGLDIEEAAEEFTYEALEMGYIDPEATDTTVYIAVEGENEEATTKLEENITEKVNKFFDKKGMFGKAARENLDEYEEQANEWGVSLFEAKIISRILELYPEMTIDEILALDFKERMDLIKDDFKNNVLPVKLRKDFKNDVNTIKEEYKELFELAKQLKKLAKELENTVLTEDELAQLQAEYDSVKEQFDALKAQYDAEIKDIKEKYAKNVNDVKNEFEQKATELRETASEALKKHEESLKNNKEDIEEKIKEWRNKANKQN